MGLREYRRKRKFDRTPEPPGATGKKTRGAKRAGAGRFVVQKHDATRLHYDFRLEHDGVLKSWAVPKGPSLDPGQKRLAVEVEDHPLEYGSFEGTIPAGEYGGGTVLLWDRGRWYPEGDVGAALRKGHLRFRLAGKKLKGDWDLVRTRSDDAKKPSWLLIKSRDDEAKANGNGDVLSARPESVSSGRRIEEIAAAPRRSWSSKRQAAAKPAAAKSEKRGARTTTSSRALPRAVEPQLATLVARAPEGDAWIHELKLDGYRILAAVAGSRVRLASRNGLDWTPKFPAVAAALAKLPVESALFDGEIVALDDGGRSSFQALQHALREGDTQDLLYYAFDLLELDGKKLGASSLLERKRQLAKLLARRSFGAVRFSDHHQGDGAELFRSACAAGAEGIISKRADAAYRPGRGRDWLKVKCGARQEVVIGGFTDPTGARKAFGALLVGVHVGDELRYAGKVGTGFDDATLAALGRRFAKLVRKDPPFVDPPKGSEGRRAHWLEPELVAEIAFTEWTADGKLRHPSFQGLREDKLASEVVREKPAAPAAEKPARSTALTHPERVLYPEQGLTKQDLADYYTAVVDAMLPHLSGRLLTLVRCPQGHTRTCFYQKHVGADAPAAIASVDVTETDGDVAPYHYVRDLPGLLALVQLGVLEIHGWLARFDDVEHPDRLVIDLDPDESLPWSAVVDGAREARRRLADLGLESWPLSTGGKGLHVVAPLQRRRGWDDVKELAREVAAAMSADTPERYLSKASKAARKGKIFVDWLRNGRGASAIVPFSTRAKPGATVATPLAWTEIARFRPGSSTVLTLPKRLARRAVDPWQGFFDVRQTPALRRRAKR